MGRGLLCKNLYIPLCAVQGGESSYRQGSVLVWNRPWTWANRCMTICQHCQDKTTAMMDVQNALLLPRFCSYNPLIINSVCYPYPCRCFLSYQCSNMRCAPLLISYVLIKNHYTAWRVFLNSSFLSSKIIDCYFDVIIYIINFFSQSQRSVNNELRNEELSPPPTLYLRYWN